MADNKIVTKRKLTGAFFQSLDGVIQGGGNPEEDRRGGVRFGGWCAAFWDESTKKPMGKILQPEFDLLLGKRTYRGMSFELYGHPFSSCKQKSWRPLVK
jgi:hypothetical protein